MGLKRAYPESGTHCLLFSGAGKRGSGTSEMRTRHMYARSSIRTGETERRTDRWTQRDREIDFSSCVSGSVT